MEYLNLKPFRDDILIKGRLEASDYLSRSATTCMFDANHETFFFSLEMAPQELCTKEQDGIPFVQQNL